MMEESRFIAVLCSANDLDAKYTIPVKDFANLLVKNKFDLVWGGTNKGLMKTVATIVQDGGRKLIGVTIPYFKDDARVNADEMILTKTLGERKALILDKSDAIVALVGGVGTLDEVMDMIELRKIGVHNKPIIVLNTEHFYDGLKTQLQKMKDDGFISNNLDELICFADTPQEAIDYIKDNLPK